MTKALVLVALFAAFALLAAASNSQTTTTVECSEIACSDGWICQNGCSTWCGLSTPTEDRPVCNPKTNTFDADPPTVPANRCNISDCGFRSVDYVKCPPGSYIYNYAGTSCVRQTDGSCKWELAACQMIPSGPCALAECGTKPAPAGQVNCVDSSGQPSGNTADHICKRNNLGICVWEWQPCRNGCTIPNAFDSVIPDFCDPLPCSPLNVPQASPDCDPTAIKECVVDYCGGCNRRYYDANRNEICVTQTRTCANIICKPDYRCFETTVLGRPECRSTLTCDNIACQEGYYCDMQSGAPTCLERQTNFVLNCANVACSSYHNCVEVNGLATCVPLTGPCSAQECVRPLCWNNQPSTGGTCSRLLSGKCAYTGDTCPFQPNPPPTRPNGDRNCLVSQWTTWACTSPCNVAGVRSRTRTVTQFPTGTGQICPELIETGTACTGSCTNPPIPPTVPVPTTLCANHPKCDDNFGRCASPVTGATCASDGAWTVATSTDLGSISFVNCNLRITGSLTSASATTLRIHSCAKITVSGSASIAGRLSLDVYNMSLQSGTRVNVVQAASLTGTFSSVSVTGLSVADVGLPFRPSYTGTAANVDFGTSVPPGTTTASTTISVPTAVAPNSGPITNGVPATPIALVPQNPTTTTGTTPTTTTGTTPTTTTGTTPTTTTGTTPTTTTGTTTTGTSTTGTTTTGTTPTDTTNGVTPVQTAASRSSLFAGFVALAAALALTL